MDCSNCGQEIEGVIFLFDLEVPLCKECYDMLTDENVEELEHIPTD